MTVSMISLALASLTACSGTDINSVHTQDPVEAQLTISALSPRSDVNYEVQQVQVKDKSNVEIHLGGSGSCPPMLDRADIVGNNVQLHLKDWGQRACTMDYRPYSQLLSDPSGKLDLKKYEYKLCNMKDECTVLPKNIDNVLKS